MISGNRILRNRIQRGVILRRALPEVFDIFFYMATKKLIYFYDALCGWCYGFSPVIQELYQQASDSIAFEVVSGGMVLGEREGPIGEVAPYIKDVYRQVEHTTGVTFGEPFLQGILEEGTTRFSSWYPAVAMAIVQDLQPGSDLAFACALQKAIYHDGKPPAEPDTYRTLAHSFDLDPEKFVLYLEQKMYHEKAQEQFDRTAKFRIGGFPTLVLELDDEYFVLTRGYMSLEVVQFRLEQVLKAHQA